MSSFSDAWAHCMHGNGLPVPDVQTLNEALEFLDKVHSAWENAGGGEELLIGALIAGGAIVVGEAALVVLGEVAQVAAFAYLGAGILCLASVAVDDLKGLFAAGQLPAFVVAQLETNGIDVKSQAPA